MQVNEAEFQASETSGTPSISPKKKLHVLEQQEELIAEELAQEEKIREATVPQKGKDQELTNEQIEDLTEAISVLSSETPVQQERDDLRELKEDRAEYKEVHKQSDLLRLFLTFLGRPGTPVDD